MQAIRNGEAVNVLDLGTLYIVPNRKFEGMSMENKDIPALAVRFLSGPLVRNAVSDIQIKEIKVAESTRLISEITDKFTKRTDGVISRGRFVVLKGNKLKIAGENSGLYICPLDDMENPVTDESSWIKCENLGKNTNGCLEFFVPESLEEGVKYKILIRTQYCTNNFMSKDAKTIVSDTVTAI